MDKLKTLAIAFHPKKQTPAILTVWYKTILEAFSARREYVSRAESADLIIPTFDVAMETSWPFYGHQAFIKGGIDVYEERAVPLIEQLLASTGSKRILIFDMFQWSSFREIFRNERRLIFACGTADRRSSRAGWDFGFPAPPCVAGKFIQETGKRKFFASFIGRNTHPLREVLARANNDKDVIIKLLPSRDAAHLRNISPQTNKRSRCSVTLPEVDAADVLDHLKAIDDEKLADMRRWVASYYHQYFSDFNRQVGAAIKTLDLQLRTEGPPRERPQSLTGKAADHAKVMD